MLVELPSSTPEYPFEYPLEYSRITPSSTRWSTPGVPLDYRHFAPAYSSKLTAFSAELRAGLGQLEYP